MKRKSLRRISVTTTAEAEDAIAELLSSVFGTPASIYSDAETGISTVSVYLKQELHSQREVRENISAGLKRMKSCGLKIGSGKIVIADIRREDWAESWKRHFKPIEIIRGRARHSVRAATMARRGRRTLPNSLLIKPSWSKRKSRKAQAVVILDPGLSFGTGHHPTTAFCLKEIVRSADSHVRVNSQRANANRASVQTEIRRFSGPRSFLDLGAGSGILAIAAAKLGYSPVRAIEFDPEAIRVARANACVNHVQQKLKILYGDVTKLPACPRQTGQGYDLICANLIADLLIRERRRIVAQLKHSGTLVLAGILRREFTKVQKAYASLGLKLVACRDQKEWCSGSFRVDKKNL